MPEAVRIADTTTSDEVHKYADFLHKLEPRTLALSVLELLATLSEFVGPLQSTGNHVITDFISYMKFLNATSMAWSLENSNLFGNEGLVGRAKIIEECETMQQAPHLQLQITAGEMLVGDDSDDARQNHLAYGEQLIKATSEIGSLAPRQNQTLRAYMLQPGRVTKADLHDSVADHYWDLLSVVNGRKRYLHRYCDTEYFFKTKMVKVRPSQHGKRFDALVLSPVRRCPRL